MNVGVLLALVGAAAFSFMNVLVRRGVRPDEADSGVLTTTIINVAAYGLLLAGLWVAGGVGTLDAEGIGWFVAAGFCATFLGRQTLFGGIQRLGAARAAAIKNATPLVTLLIALLALGERLSFSSGIGVALILVGLGALIAESLRRPHPPATPGATDPIEAALSSEALAEAGFWGRTRTLADRTMALFAEPSRRSIVLGVVLSSLAALAFGTGHAFRKLGMDALPNALVGATIGSFTAFAAFLMVAAARRQAVEVLRSALRADRPAMWGAGAAGTVGQLSFFAALAYAPVAHVSVVAGSETVITVILAAVLTRRLEIITRHIVIPAGLVFIGTAMIAIAR